MAEIESRVAAHYGRSGLEATILAALAAAGKDLDRLTADDLSPVDEFHIGGRQATAALAARMALPAGARLLDIGCGIGGASRYFAAERGARVTGIDLTEDYVRVAAALSRRVGLAERVDYRRASALALPFPAASFDGAYTIHVGMNIADKPALFAEARRVLRAGAPFAIFDVMRAADGALAFPLPWAASAETSFLAGPADYRRGLEAAGFAVLEERDCGDLARAFFGQMAASVAEAGGPPPLGVHLLLNPDAAAKLANIRAAVDGGLVAPVEIICRAQ